MTLTIQLHAINTTKHRITDAMESVGIDCNGLPFYLYANALMERNGLDSITTGNPPAAETLETKLEKLEAGKAYLAQAINECGGLITESTPFRAYPDQIRLCDGMAGTSWSTAGGVNQAIKAAVYATDGYIYLCGSSKVWKTADMQTFTELNLVGTITGSLSGICECSGQRIVVADNGYLWVKPANDDNITKTGMRRSYNKTVDFPVSGRPDSPVVWFHSLRSLNDAGVVRTLNINTGLDNYGTFALHPAGLYGFALEPGVLSDDPQQERWVFTGRRNNEYYIQTLKFFWAGVGSPPAWVHIAASEYGYENTNMSTGHSRLCKAPAGRIWAAGRSNSKLFGHYSDAHGLAFSDPYFTTVDADPTAITALRANWLLVGSSGEIRRVRNNFRSIETVASINGSPTAFLHLPGNKILCCTDSTSGTNLYITEA